MPRAAHKTTAEALRGRANKATTIKQIIAVIAGIQAFIGGAVVARDTEKYRTGLLLLVHAQRRGGLFLEQTIAVGGKTQVTKLGIEGAAHRWRELAKMSDAELERSLQWCAKRGLPREPEQRQKQAAQIPTKMHITPFEVDENGCLSRTLSADGETPALQGERSST